MSRTCISVAMLVGIGSTVPAIAQDISPPAIDVLSPHLSAIEFGRQNAQTINKGVDSNPGFSVDDLGSSLTSGLVAPTSQSDTQAARSVDTSYRYDRQRTRANLSSFVERTPIQAGRADLQRTLEADPGLIPNIRTGMESYGFDPNDVADNYAMWWMTAWMVFHKQDEDPDNGTISMVRQQVRRAFAETPDFAQANDAQRQAYAEALMLQASMLTTAYNHYKSNDPKMLDQLAAAAQQGAKASGIDLSRMTLTQAGFVPRK